MNMEKNAEFFNEYLENSLLTLNQGDAYDTITEWLTEHGFYTAPSSTRFHEAYPGGLVEHSLNVRRAALELADSPAFKSHFETSVSKAEISIAALLHDICKCDRYESYTDKLGKICYKYADDKPNPFGHGVTSALLVQKFIPSVPEHVLCAIRWHMSAWDITGTDGSDLGVANKKYPLVHLIQFADQISITNWWD